MEGLDEEDVPAFRIGVDTGGTFTDVVGVKGDKVFSWKLSSTPEHFEHAVLEGARQVSRGEAAQLIHSTTVATNALLERKGSRCALITTRGFRDVLEIGRQARPDLYDLCPKTPEPLISSDFRFEITERVNSRGETVTPLQESELDGIVEALHKEKIESVAVVFLFSFLLPEHEQRVGERLRKEGFRVSLSCEVLPEFREYERTSTTVANAFVQPVMTDYLNRLEVSGSEQKTGHLNVVQSNGGTLSPERAGRFAVHTLLSGPAAGIQGAVTVAEAGDPETPRKWITFDMGGTSTDVALIDGYPQISTEMKLGDVPIGVPMMNIHTVGAGGGSLARVDAGGALQVGPESAGADPGPACYGKGGGPTVTDAHVVLGNVLPEFFLQGRMTLHHEASWEVMRTLGKEMGGLSAEEAARGVLEIATVHMENAIRVISVQRGHDPGECTLIGFGGAGGLHSFALAEALQVQRVLVPCHPGVLSALGAISGAVRREAGATIMKTWSQEFEAGLKERIDQLRSQVADQFRVDGYRVSEPSIRITFDTRYVGQSHELHVKVSPEEAVNAVDHFHDLHHKQFGFCDREAPVEVVTIRVAGELPTPGIPFPDVQTRSADHPHLSFESGWIQRRDLLRGDCVKGPLLIVDDFHTVVLPKGWEVETDRIGNLVGTRVSG